MSRIARVWAVLRSAGYERVRGLAEALAQREVKGSPTLVWGICAKTILYYSFKNYTILFILVLRGGVLGNLAI